MNVSPAFDNNMPRADSTRDFARVVDDHGAQAMEIASKPAFDQCFLANDAAAGEIAFTGEMDVATGSNASAESAGDFVVPQVNVCATCRADRRSGCATHLLFPITFEAFDNRASLSFPKILEAAKD